MKKTIFTILKVGGIALAVLLLLVGGAVVSLNTSSVQNKLIMKATEMLSEKLNTVVTTDCTSKTSSSGPCCSSTT